MHIYYINRHLYLLRKWQTQSSVTTSLTCISTGKRH